MTSGTAEPRARSATLPKLLGSEEPRIFTPPLRELTPETTLGFECIAFAENILGLELMPWQKWLLLHALELHPHEVDESGAPTFRFRKVILLVGRQNGKSTVMQALTLWRMFVDRCSLTIGTAQDLEIAEALWGEAVEIVEETETLRAQVGKTERQPGRKMFKLKTGETYKVKAATRRGGRGLSGELVLLDELREHQTWDAWGAVTKTTNAKARAQIYGISNAGDTTSVVLSYLRKKAHASLGDPDGLNRDAPSTEPTEDEIEELGMDDSGMAIFEWSAPPGCAIDDREGWAWANPSLGWRMRESTLASDCATDPEWVFRTEVLCQWSEGTLQGPFPPGAWEAGQVLDAESAPQIVGDVVAGLGMSADRAQTVIAFAGRDEDGRAQVEIVARRGGTDWVEGWLSERRGIVTGIGGQGRGAPESALIESLGLAGLPVQPIAGSDLSGATGAFYDAVRHNTVTHLAHPALDAAAQTAVPKVLEGGAILWDRKRSPIDISALQAATCALWLLERPVEAPAVSVYEARGVMTI